MAMAVQSDRGASASHSPRWIERWWAGELGWRGRVLDAALAPAELLFRVAVRVRGMGYDREFFEAGMVGAPVISVGNLAVGGAGKTPVSRWLVSELLGRGERPAVLHGGYAEDEPELHRRWNPNVPVMVGRDRIVTARRAVEEGATVLVLDDGFQHRRLARDLDIVLVTAEGWSSRPRLLPRGPWREGPIALARAGAVVVTRKTARREKAMEVARELRRYAPTAVLARLWLAPAGWTRVGPREGADERHATDRPTGEVVALTAIARPDLFVENARSAGADVVETIFFPDHHDYGPEDLERIRKAAAGRPIVTTAKDLVKLGGLDPALELWVLEQEVVVEDGGEELSRLIDRTLEGSLPR